MLIKRFEELPIWRLSLALTKQIYDLTSDGRFAKDFGLRDQIRRAIVSVSSNIVGGFEKSNNNEFVRFLKIAKGSCGEVRNQTHTAFAIGYITKPQFNTINDLLIRLGGQIGGFTHYLIKKKSDKKFIENKSVIRNA